MKILIISPHTDDAELGAGGSIIKFIEQGNDVFWVVFSTAEDALPSDFKPDTLEKEFLSVVNSLNINKNNYRVFKNQVRNLNKKRQEILDSLITIRHQFDPELVIGPSMNDYHQDHQVVANEMVRAFKTHCGIISYELPWNHINFDCQLFIKLNRNHMKKKIDLLLKYKSQIYVKKQYFSEEYIYGLAKVRGVQCSAEYSEAFEVIRWMM